MCTTSEQIAVSTQAQPIVFHRRIERLWKDVNSSCVNSFREILFDLEQNWKLDLDNEVHMWAVHYIYLPRVNASLAEFVNAHNHTKIRTAGNKSPWQLWINGMPGAEDIIKADDQIVAEDGDLYGLDPDAPEPDEKEGEGTVEVPKVPCPLSPQALEQLRHEIDPLDPLDESGGRRLWAQTVLFVCDRVAAAEAPAEL